VPLDSWMPAWDVHSVHAIEVGAAADNVYQALLDTDFGRNPVLVALMAVRAVPALLLSPREAFQRWREAESRRAEGPMGHLLAGAFVLLEARRPVEMVLGLTGRFWTPAGGLLPTDPARFLEPPPPGVARAAWSFRLEPRSPERTLLRTETRVLCADAATRASFLRYWWVIQIGSGVIRHALLWQVKIAAERAAA
jgi:hypothetical protein